MKLNINNVKTRHGAALLSVAMIAPAIACGDDDNPAPPPGAEPGATPTASEVTISIEPGASTKTTDAFGENPKNIPLGTNVTWINNDTVSHTTTSTTGIWDSGTLAPGESFSRVFNEAGNFP